MSSFAQSQFNDSSATPRPQDVSVEGVERILNLSAGNAPLYTEVMQKAQKEMLNWKGKGISVMEMGYRTKNFHDIMHSAESSFRELMGMPDDFEFFMFDGGATLQFAGIPMNLCGGSKPKVGNYLLNGHWSEKARSEGAKYVDTHTVWTDPEDKFLTVDGPEKWTYNKDATYFHYCTADTRQGFEFHNFPYHGVPESNVLCADMSANLGTKAIDWSKYGVVYAAMHKNFSTSGATIMCIRKSLIDADTVMPFTPRVTNWSSFYNSPQKIYNVPTIWTIWLFQLTCEHMLAKGGLSYFDAQASRRANRFYDLIDSSDGFYRTFVQEEEFRSRMNICFTIKNDDKTLIDKFINTAESEEHGWLDVRGHPMSTKTNYDSDTNSIRATIYNPQRDEAIDKVLHFMDRFRTENS